MKEKCVVSAPYVSSLVSCRAAASFNQPFSAWDRVFPDAMMAVAAIDRLIHHAHVFELSGQSYRKRAHTRATKEVPTTG